MFSMTSTFSQVENSKDEATLKALFIYTFTKHIDWPEESFQNGQFTITVFGNYNITGKLVSMLKGREVYGKKIVIVEAEETTAIQNSQIIFIANSKIDEIKSVMERFKNQAVLIITEEMKMPAGSDINLRVKNNKLTFELNETQLKAEGLKISHQLHDLAEKVY
jgi:hypothetical protein